MTQRGFICSICGARHAGPPTAYESTAPQAWFALSEQDRAERGRIDGEIAMITGSGGLRAFLRGSIEIPVAEAQQPLVMTVWVELGAADLREVLGSWHDADRADGPPLLSVLANDVLGFPASVGLGALLYPREVGTRPRIQLTPDEHPLVVAQRDGITIERVQQIAELVAHPAGT
ncbi:MAG: DUF2199 domain-containing protein [Actinomycetota bacterium]